MNEPFREHDTTVLVAQSHPAGHTDVWHWLQPRIPWYPRERPFWPWTKPKRKDRWKPIAMVGVDVSNGPDHDTNLPVALTYYTPERGSVTPLHGETTDAATVASVLFSSKTRGHTMVFLYGLTFELNGLLRWYGRAWNDLGYALTPVVSGTHLRCLLVRKGRNRWTLTDAETMTGHPPGDILDSALGNRGVAEARQGHLPAVWQFIAGLQTATMQRFGTYLRPTVGGTAIKVAGRYLPDGHLIPRPCPHLVAMCRAGAGYRGGYVFGVPYRGVAYKADVRRLYAHCLRAPLPSRWALGRGVCDLGERKGVFVCTVSGVPLHPVALGIWDGPERGFLRKLWTGGECIAILPSSEYLGLRAMGLTVTPGWGFAAIATIDLSPLVVGLGDAIAEHGPESSLGRLSKLIGNAIYGKMAMRPEREGIVWSATAPSALAFPMVTLDGVRVPDLWAVDTVAYSPFQQIGMATMITGSARSVLYVEMAKRIREGRRIVHAHTDGYVATGPPPDDLPNDTDAIGAWRLVEQDTDTTVVRGGGYVIGADVKWSGAPGWTRQQIEIAYERGWAVRGQRVR